MNLDKIMNNKLVHTFKITVGTINNCKRWPPPHYISFVLFYASCRTILPASKYYYEGEEEETERKM